MLKYIKNRTVSALLPTGTGRFLFWLLILLFSLDSNIRIWNCTYASLVCILKYKTICSSACHCSYQLQQLILVKTVLNPPVAGLRVRNNRSCGMTHHLMRWRKDWDLPTQTHAHAFGNRGQGGARSHSSVKMGYGTVFLQVGLFCSSLCSPTRPLRFRHFKFLNICFRVSDLKGCFLSKYTLSAVICFNWPSLQITLVFV